MNIHSCYIAQLSEYSWKFWPDVSDRRFTCVCASFKERKTQSSPKMPHLRTFVVKRYQRSSWNFSAGWLCLIRPKDSAGFLPLPNSCGLNRGQTGCRRSRFSWDSAQNFSKLWDISEFRLLRTNNQTHSGEGCCRRLCRLNGPGNHLQIFSYHMHEPMKLNPVEDHQVGNWRRPNPSSVDCC